MNDTEIQAIAVEMKAAQDNNKQLQPWTSRYENFTLADAYSVAEQIHKVRMSDGAIPIGRKIGFTNHNMWNEYGVTEPIWAYIYKSTLDLISDQSVQCSLAQFSEPKIEPEIILHFGSTPPVTNNVEEILSCIDWIALGIEMVQSHYPGWKFQAADTVADWSLHGRLYVGQPLHLNPQDKDIITQLQNFTVELSFDEEVLEKGIGSNVLGSPIQAIAHLISVLSKQSHAMPLQANELVTTGTVTSAYPVHTGETWSTKLDGIALPGISISFVE